MDFHHALTLSRARNMSHQNHSESNKNHPGSVLTNHRSIKQKGQFK